MSSTKRSREPKAEHRGCTSMPTPCVPCLVCAVVIAIPAFGAEPSDGAYTLALRKAKLMLFGAQPLVAETLSSAGLLGLIPMAADEAEALALARA